MKKSLGFLCTVLVALPASAVQFPDQAKEPEVGSVSQLMALQREGRLASSNPQPATDLEREKAVDRFLNTYNNTIPNATLGGGSATGAGGGVSTGR